MTFPVWLALVYLLACGVLLNAMLAWWGYCWLIGAMVDRRESA